MNIDIDDRRRLGKRLNPNSQLVGTEVFVRAKFDVVWRLSELDESALAVCVHEANSWLSVHPFVHCKGVFEWLCCCDAVPRLVRNEVCPFAGVGMRCRHDAEVFGVEVRRDDESVTPVVD